MARLSRPGWARTVHARRALAAALVVLAAVLAVRGDPSTRTSPVVVAVRDLAPGAVLTGDDLALTSVSSRSVPDGAVVDLASVTGRTLAGAVRGGEQLTDVRVLGADLARAATGRPDTTSVPVRLGDPDVADLLRPGDEVDVLALGEDVGSVRVVVRGAVVLAVPPETTRTGTTGRLVVLGVPGADAPDVAAASLEQTLTVTFR